MGSWFAYRTILDKISEYFDEGYSLRPPRKGVISTQAPDFLFYREGLTVVLEVKSGHWKHLKPAPRLSEGRPSRVDFLWLPDAELSSIEMVGRRAVDAARILESGHLEAALIMAVAAIEAAMHRIALTLPGRDIPTPESLTPLIGLLLDEGLLEEVDPGLLDEIFVRRNQVAHGYALDDQLRKPFVAQAVQLAQQLLSSRKLGVHEALNRVFTFEAMDLALRREYAQIRSRIEREHLLKETLVNEAVDLCREVTEAALVSSGV
ncbi:hypothetical protein AB0M43_37425 [Longispora sp. NPDC051575]|uniref:hypothetical protein n=1 Tax=Longispora sp. NPDC051575 TaxID=3154943 RepID=UPI00343A0B7F